MSKCLNCEKPTELNQRTLKPKKYCSNKCAHQHYHKKNHISTRQLGWGNKTIKKEEEKRKRAEELVWYRENCLTTAQVAEKLNIQPSSAWHRAKNQNISGTRHGRWCFWSPSDVEKLKYKKTPIPEGYMTRKEACDYLGYTPATFQVMRPDYGHPKHTEWRETHGNKSMRYLYKKEDIDEWMASVREKRKQKREETKRQQQIRRAAKQKAKEEAERIFQKQISGLITSKEAAAILGLESIGGHGLKMPSIKPKGRFYYKPEDVEVYRKQREAELAKKEQAHSWKLRKTDWKDPKQYEAKILRKIKALRWPKKHSSVSINKNIEFNKEWERGNITKLGCASCKEQEPFYDFYVRWDQHRARDKYCKECLRAKSTENLKTTQYQESTTTKLRRIVGISIKSHIRRNRGEYPEEIDMKLMWQKLQQHCGYDQFVLKEHLEAQFSNNMTWDSYGRGDKAKREGFSWNIDHIVPKSTFHYTDLDDPEFKECWKLDNVRPLGAVLNSVRGDKDLIAATRSSFRNGIMNTKSECKSGVWSYLPYTPSEARAHLEDMFDSNISWANYGPDWHVDHIVPIAGLPFDSMEHPNFQKVWELKNLQPLVVTANLSKGSKHGGVRHLYNDVTDQACCDA